MSDVSNMITLFQQNQAAFDANADLTAFAAALPAGRGAWLQRYVGGWAELVYRGAKAHGLDRVPHRPLHLPEARTLKDVVQDMRLMASSKGAESLHDAKTRTGGRRYISTRNIPDAPGGHMGPGRGWSMDWLKRGERLRSHGRGCYFAGLYANPTNAVRKAWEKHIGACDDYSERGYDFALASFEFVRWEDGRTLVIGRAGSVFTMWLAVLDADQCDLVAALTTDDRALWEQDQAAKAAAWPPAPEPTSWYVVKGQDRQRGALGILEPFETRVKAGDIADAENLARLQRMEAFGREHINIISIAAE